MAMRERQRQRKEEAIFWNRAAQHPARVERWHLRGDFGLYDRDSSATTGWWGSSTNWKGTPFGFLAVLARPFSRP